MALPFKPETMASAKQRIHAALDMVWNAAGVSKQLRDRGRFEAVSPLNRREHVFDFRDGLRLVVNREKASKRICEVGSRTIIHVSATVRIEESLGFNANAKEDWPRLWKLMADRIAALLSTPEVPCEVPEEPVRWDRGIGHWHLEGF